METVIEDPVLHSRNRFLHFSKTLWRSNVFLPCVVGSRHIIGSSFGRNVLTHTSQSIVYGMKVQSWRHRRLLYLPHAKALISLGGIVGRLNPHPFTDMISIESELTLFAQSTSQPHHAHFSQAHYQIPVAFQRPEFSYGKVNLPNLSFLRAA